MHEVLEEKEVTMVSQGHADHSSQAEGPDRRQLGEIDRYFEKGTCDKAGDKNGNPRYGDAPCRRPIAAAGPEY